MATKRAEVLTPWTEYIEDGIPFRAPLVTMEHQVQRYADITGQDAANLVPAPNLFSALIEADETVIDAISTDDRFNVLWEEYI